MTKAVKQWKIPTVVIKSMVVCVLTFCALLHSMCDLKAPQMNVQHSLIQELLLYEFKLGHNTAEATKNIYCMNGEGIVDHSTVTRWLKKFYLCSKNIDDQARSGRLKTVHSEAMFQAIEANSMSNIRRISCDFSISQSTVVCHLHNLKLKNCASHYQNIAKLLTHPCIDIKWSDYKKFIEYFFLVLLTLLVAYN